MDPKDLDKLIEKYLEGKCTKEESAYIDSLYASLGRDPGGKAGPSEAPMSSAESRILSALEAHRSPPPADVVRGAGRRYFRYYSGIAASLLLAIAIGFYLLPDRDASPVEAPVEGPSTLTSIENTSLEARRVTLPDGSLVEMSAGSRISFDRDAASASREVFLEGEAYFDVAHDSARPFYVYAGNVVTRVLGTSFIVRALDEDGKITVSVKTGKVTVYSKNAVHKKTVLVPNQAAIYDRATDEVATQVVPADALHEEKRYFAEMHFEETPVSEVLMTLMEKYDIEIAFKPEALSACVLTSSFYEEGLYDRIDVICTAIGATYKIVDAHIEIESKGCNLNPDEQ